MAPRRWVARVDAPLEESEGRLVRSPAVGVVEGLARAGRLLDPEAAIGALLILGTRAVLVLPRGVHGRVGRLHVDGSSAPVEYGQPLFELRPLNDAEVRGAPGVSGVREGNEAADAGLGVVEVRSPTHGVFYRRPGTNRPPYVEVGSLVERGTVLGLVEVMKCFNPVFVGGAEPGVRGVVRRILAEDVSEVSLGQVLFHVQLETGQ